MDSKPSVTVSVRSPVSLRHRLVRPWKSVGVWCMHQWGDLRPGPEARRGAVWGSAAAALVAAIIAGLTIKSGFGIGIDLIFCLIAAMLLILVSSLFVAMLLTFCRRMPRLASGLIFGSVMVVALSFMPIGIGTGPIVCLTAGILGASISTILASDFRGATRTRKTVVLFLLAVSLAAAVMEILFLASEGSPAEEVLTQPGIPVPETLQAPDPGAAGPFKYRVIRYGTRGGNRRRPEYDNPDIATPTVDASGFFREYRGWCRYFRKVYWGFDLDRLPLNATVWIPSGTGPFPLVLMVHGNHNMAEFSDPGYQYLGELLASRGFLFASIDENFLNSSLFDELPEQQAARGWMLLEHLKLWRDWSLDPGNPIGAAIDFHHIALVGHSRGGEAAATAALFNRMTHYPEDADISFQYGFPILSVLAIAPPDGQYKPAGQWRTIEDVNYFTIQGANDADVSSFTGSRQWERIGYPSGGDWFKSELYVYRANHGQFNTVWGRSDAGYPLGWLLNLKPLLAPRDQRRIAKVYISAFLEATLRGRREYLPMFRDYRTIRDWVPDTVYINRYQDAFFSLVADFNEDPDLTTTTLAGGRISGEDLAIWREGRIPFREGNRDYNGVFLGWNRTDPEGREDRAIHPVYGITLPGTAPFRRKAPAESCLVLSVAALDEDVPRMDQKTAGSDGLDEATPGPWEDQEPVDFTIELETSDGAVVSRPVSSFGTILPPLRIRFTKIAYLDKWAYKKSFEPVFQTLSIPMSAFSGSRGFDPARLITIRLRFDRTMSGVILLSKIGFD